MIQDIGRASDLGGNALAISKNTKNIKAAVDALLFICDPENTQAFITDSGPFTHAQGLSAALDLLSLSEPPQAIFSGGVLLTLGVLQALRERRLRWPHDIAVVGYPTPAGQPWSTLH